MTQQMSEQQAIDRLASLGVINADIANIMKDMASRTPRDVMPPEGSSVRLLVVLLDRSGSMEPLEDAVIENQRHMISALLGASSAMEIYLGQVLFNHEIHPFQDMSPFRDPNDPHKAHPNTKLLDHSTYKAEGGTALYDTILHGISMLMPLLLTAEESGQQVLANLAVMTDAGKGGEHSKTAPEALKQVIDFVLQKGIIYRITLYGLGGYDYKDIAKRIGIRDVIEVGADPRSIRRAFDMISSQTVRDTV